jgi:hypothetical protein
VAHEPGADDANADRPVAMYASAVSTIHMFFLRRAQLSRKVKALRPQELVTLPLQATFCA